MAGGIEGMAQTLREQLRCSDISTEHMSEYMTNIVYVLKRFDLQVDIESVDDGLFDSILEINEPARTKCLWLFSLLDDNEKGHKSEKIALPLMCCSNMMELRQSKPNAHPFYHCEHCKSGIRGRISDYWVHKDNYPRSK